MSTTTFTSAPAGTWSADPVHSNVGFEIDYAGTNVFRGGFNEYAVTLEDGVLEGAAKVASVDVKDEQLSGHLQTPTSSTPSASRRSPSARATSRPAS